jgi:monoterpene epsilon-lactone hydrolase
MSTAQKATVEEILRNAPLDLGGDPAVMRGVFRTMLSATPVPADVRTTPITLGGVPAVRVDIDGATGGGTILHFHGGCYAIGSADTSVGLVAGIARRARARAYSVDYRLAPENRFPAATDDALAAYRGLLESGTPAASIVLTGESAGAGLAVATLLAAKAAGLPLPSAAVLLSPWADLTQSGDSISAKADVDPSVTGRALQIRADDYLSDADPLDPLASPVFGDLAGLPPLLIQAGSHEVLLSDAVRLAAKAAADDVDVTLDVVPGVPHVFQAFAGILDEGAAALDRVAAFITGRLLARQV